MLFLRTASTISSYFVAFICLILLTAVAFPMHVPDMIAHQLPPTAQHSSNSVQERSRNETDGEEMRTNMTTAKGASDSHSLTDTSHLLCQFFVFGTLFGIVCSISACTCLLRSRRSSRCQTVGPAEEPSISRLVQFREPFAMDKPCCLKCENGYFYASPLKAEIPPLPDYDAALLCLRPADLLKNKI